MIRHNGFPNNLNHGICNTNTCQNNYGTICTIKPGTPDVQESPIVRSSKSSQIAEQLRQAIVGGRFKIGERPPTEDELAQRFGVSL
jgi:hypothetical protein